MDTTSKNAAKSTACFDVTVDDALAAERVAAEAWAAGAIGIEEREDRDALRLIIYAPESAISAVRDAAEGVAVAKAVGSTRSVPDTDWSQQWKAGLGVISVTPRLRIRPSFIDPPSTLDQRELVIDPGQAFGTGSHASTLIALEWIDALAASLPPHPKVLDVGTGTGVLALASVLLADADAVGFDIDPLAIAAARENARVNASTASVHFFVGSLAAMPHARFDLVVANLLKSEMLPLIPSIEAATHPAGYVLLSGLLETDAREICTGFQATGMERVGERSMLDPNGDRWVGLLMRR